MKKTRNAPVENDEEDNVSVSPSDRIAYKARKQHEAALKAAMARLERSKTGGNPAKNSSGNIGASMHIESNEEYYFSFMNSILAEKVMEILEAKKTDPSNMISPEAKLSKKTSVELSGPQGMNPSAYAQAQGVVGEFKKPLGESDDSPQKPGGYRYLGKTFKITGDREDDESHHLDRKLRKKDSWYVPSKEEKKPISNKDQG